MKRKVLYTSLLLIVISCILIGYLVLPRGKSQLLLDYYSKNYDEPLERFQAMYDQGDHTLSVINPLVQLYLDHANPSQAIALLEEFNREHPGRTDVLKTLSGLYQGADMPSSDLVVKEELFALKPTKEALELLVAQCAYMGQKGKWEEYLRLLTQQYQAEPDAYESLALHYAAMNQFDQAITAIDQGLERCKNYAICGSAATLKVSILLNQNRVDEAVAFAKSYSTKRNALENYPDLIQLFILAKHPDQALVLLNELPENVLEKPAYIDVTIQTLIQLNNNDELLSYLIELHNANKLKPGQYQTLVSFALDRKIDPQLLEAFLTPKILESLPEDLWFTLVEWANEQQRYTLLDRLKVDIPERLIVNAPLVRYAVELSGEKSPNPKDLGFYLIPNQAFLTPEDAVHLAIFYDQLGLNKLALESLETLSSFDGISLSLIPQASSLYWPESLAQEGYDKIDALRLSLENPPNSIMSSWVALSIITGRDKQAKAWLELNSDELSNAETSQIFEAALYAKNANIALYMAHILTMRFPSPDSTLAYANALILNNEFAEGIQLLEQLERTDPQLKKLPVFLLLAYAKASLTNPEYIDQLNLRLQQTTLKSKEWFLVAFELQEEGLNQQALQIFMKLAESDEQSQEALEMVVYLFGEKLNQEQADWLIARLRHARVKNKVLILSSLAHGGYPEAVLASVSQSELRDPEIFESYLLAAAMLKRNELVYSLIQDRLAQHPSITQIRKWIQVLDGHNQFLSEEALYLAILEIHPNDRKALRELGNLYYDEGVFSSAKNILALYFMQGDPDALSLFQYAELYQRDGDYFHARPFYYAVLSAPEVPDEKINYLEIKALSFYRLNYPFFAISLLGDGLGATKKGQKDLTGTLVNLFLDLDWIDYSVPFLFCHQSSAKDSLYIENLRTTWYMKANEREDAFAQSDYVLSIYPEEPYAWSSRAQLEYEIGHYREALDTYEYASALKPQDENLDRSIEDIINQHRSFTHLGWEYKTTGLTQKEHLWKFQQAFNPIVNSRFLFAATMDRFDINAYTNAQTGLTDSAHGNRTRYGLAWIHDCYGGWQSYQELYAQTHIFGGGSHFSYFDLYGASEIGLELRRPNWDFAETIVEYGSRDRIYMQRAQKLDERIEGLLRIEARRYHLQHTGSKAAESIAWVGDLIYTLPQSHWMVRCMGHDSIALFNYNIDAEYGTWTKRRRNAEGEFFYPLNVGKREIHTMEMAWRKTQYRFCHFNAHFGFAYDRFGGVNKALAVYGGSVLWDKRPGLTFELFYDHSPSPSVTGANQDRYMINCIYYY